MFNKIKLPLRIRYKKKYYYVKFMHFIGLCPKCFNFVNYTRDGRAKCPNGCKF